MDSKPAILIVESSRDLTVRLKAAIHAALPQASPIIARSVEDIPLYVRARAFDVIVAGPIESESGTDEELRELRKVCGKAPLILLDNSRLERSVKVIDESRIAALVPLDDTAPESVARHILTICPAEPARRKLALKRPSDQNVDLIKITAGTLYHEISNPLMTILGMAELILDENTTRDPEVTRKIEAIRESAGRIQSTLNRLINIDEPALRDTASGKLIDPRPFPPESQG